MKIALVTINGKDLPNYGNALQAYAAVNVLKKYTNDVTLLDLEFDKKEHFINKLRYLFLKLFGFNRSSNPNYWKFGFAKRNKFIKFIKKHINEKHFDNLDNLNEKFDFFAVGSDQVWNVSWYEADGIQKDLYLLSFAEPKKRVCISPSFGIESLPDEWKPLFKKQLAEYPRLSVREESGAKIIKELTGKDAEVLIDPTLLLDSNDWLKISKKPNINCGKRFVLTYFLGNKTEKISKKIEDLKQKGYEIIELNNKNNAVLFSADPGEFIWLVSNSSIVLTDSFHACVFSFIFSKPFIVYNRSDLENNMFSRIETLLAKFKLERKFEGSNIFNDDFEHDYNEGYEILETERKKVYEFIEKSLK